ncbi:regulator of chromosome condensation 1/beta-lactamase-inhibitor protein II [Lipomyces japonicus]|uniref:regulator of chromosome condensation 1/beta-lactamase-inhibitor protein II n=1 Tax=Lipomyces japonicus TaxID=56871 RepID=UPI0034CD47CA
MTQMKSAIGKLKIFSFGSNSRCQLSLPTGEDVSVPTLVGKQFEVRRPLEPQHLELVSNGNHTLLRLKHVVYSVGDNSFGQCFQSPSTEPIRSFEPVSQLLPANMTPVKIAAGWEFSVVVYENKSTGGQAMYVAGTGPRGELGLGPNVRVCAQQHVVPSFPPAGRRINRLAAGMSHVVAVLDDGTAYGWGNARQGQLGPEHVACRTGVWAPAAIALPDGFSPADVACGTHFTAFTSTSGQVVVLTSKDKHGVITDVPEQRGLLRSGWTSLHMLQGTGDITSWGNNSHGQHRPEQAPKAAMMACGSEHTIVLDRDTERAVYAWGWGEHGNCGQQQDGEQQRQHVVVTMPRQVFSVDSQDGHTNHRIVYLAAGCAASWIFMVEDE